MFQDDKNTPRNQQTKQELDQTRFSFVVTFVDMGIWVVRGDSSISGWYC
jgi:hypothetical protein